MQAVNTASDNVATAADDAAKAAAQVILDAANAALKNFESYNA